MIIEILVCLFLIIGIIFIFSASVGLLRFPDVYCRMHATSKASTLGLISVLIASIIFFNQAKADFHAFAIEELLVLVFIFLSAPVATHIMARTAYLLNNEKFSKTGIDELAYKHLKPVSQNNMQDGLTD